MELYNELCEIRRDLHSHPELRFKEKRTAGVVFDYLRERGFSPHRGLARTGVVATLDTGTPGPDLLLRADIDALPIQERSDVPYASRSAGKMHACGHDGHTVMLLGAAATLASKPPPRGRIHFVFQPAEEGGSGADVMIREGIFDLFPSEVCFGLHNWPGLAPGRFAVRKGPIMAGGWRFAIRIEGAGAHAAQPQFATDVVLAGAELVSSLQGLVARRVDPLVPAVLSVCQFQAGDTDNILPTTALLAGTIRALDPRILDMLKDGIRQVAEGVAIATRTSILVEFHSHYPVTVNDPTETERAVVVMRSIDVSVEDAADAETVANMTSEDFGFFLSARPGVYALIGNGSDSAALHTPSYDFNDSIIPRGVAYWTELAHRRTAIDS